MKKVFLFAVLIMLYTSLIFPFTAYMKSKPIIEKVGYVPQAKALKIVSADHKQLTAALLVMKVLLYFGGLMETSQKEVTMPPEYFGMYKIIETAVKIDPYNMDSYYFAQAIFVWDARQVMATNSLLDYGMKYRDWDFYLPFFAGFNSSYFLKDYRLAAKYYKRAAELSGSDLFTQLAGRYMYEAGQTEHAIIYLSMMEKTEKNDAIKKSYATRLKALKEVKRIEDARDKYKRDFGKIPSIDDLTGKGYLKPYPEDPYGGKFFVDERGKVRTTSKFAYGVREQEG